MLGQSFGGFCACTYLSFAPEGLREAFFTGGLPPVAPPVDDVYRATYDARAASATAATTSATPTTASGCARCTRGSTAKTLRLPSGDRLTPRRFRQLGNELGMSDGAERLHYLLELPAGLAGVPARRRGRRSASRRNPLYAILHEACYADGVRDPLVGRARCCPDEFASTPELFTGEHVYPWMFEDYGALAPLREAAELLAEHEWPRLYDAERLAAERRARRRGVYAEDMYVERALLRGDRRAHQGPAHVADQRVRARRPAQGRARPRAA